VIVCEEDGSARMSRGVDDDRAQWKLHSASVACVT
jgi:hypothetical protein